MQTIKCVCCQFFRLPGIADKTDQRLHQPGIVSREEIFENVILRSLQSLKVPGEAA